MQHRARCLHYVMSGIVGKLSLSCTMLSAPNMLISFVSATNHERTRRDLMLSTKSHWLVSIFKGCFLKMSFFSNSEPKISTSAALTYTKLSSLIPLYILKVFTEGFVHISFRAWFIEHFFPKNRAKIDFFLWLVTIFSDFWSGTKRYPKSPL